LACALLLNKLILRIEFSCDLFVHMVWVRLAWVMTQFWGFWLNGGIDMCLTYGWELVPIIKPVLAQFRAS